MSVYAKLAFQSGIEKKVYLGCQNALCAASTKIDLQAQTNKSIVEAILIDTSELASMRKAVKAVRKQPMPRYSMLVGISV